MPKITVETKVTTFTVERLTAEELQVLCAVLGPLTGGGDFDTYDLYDKFSNALKREGEDPKAFRVDNYKVWNNG